MAKEQARVSAQKNRIQAWIKASPARPTFAVLINQSPSQELTERTLASIQGQFYPPLSVHRVGEDLHEAAEALVSRGELSADYLVFVSAGDLLSPDALYEYARATESGSPEILYPDEDRIQPDGSFADPYFKPDLAMDQLRCEPYLVPGLAISRAAFTRLGGFRRYPGTEIYDLALRASEAGLIFGHIRRILYHRDTLNSAAPTQQAMRALRDHLGRCELQAEISTQDLDRPDALRVRYRVAQRPLVSLLIPTDDRTRMVEGRGEVNLLSNFVESIKKSTYPNFELIIADNGNISGATLDKLKSIDHRLVSYRSEDRDFNLSRKINFGFSHARGSHLLLLNDDLEVISPDWIEALLEYSQQEKVGAVGARLLYPNRTLQHVGMVFGPKDSVVHRYRTFPCDTPGDHGAARIVRNYSCVTGACLMTRRELWDRMGGFDTALPIDYNDANYCLGLAEQGLRTVYTPYCELYHFDQGTLSGTVKRGQARDIFEARWKKYFSYDPYYNNQGFELSPLLG